MTVVAAAYCDGGVAQASRSAIAGAWAWCWVDEYGVVVQEDSGLLIPTRSWPTITNNYAEYVAAVRALAGLPDKWHGTLYSDSGITLGRLLQGWRTEGLPEALVERGNVQVKRVSPFRAVLLQGHPTKEELATGLGKTGRPVSEHNVRCDQRCAALLHEYAAKHGTVYVEPML